MNIKGYGNIVKSIALALGMSVMASCSEEDLVLSPIDDSGLTGGDRLDLTVTLDNMGGASIENNQTLREWENYIDPEKFRVLFFTCETDASGKQHDYFLFESKSRWIKQLEPDGDHSRWQVSIPFFSYGNDANEKYDWDWAKIREKLTGGKFKIAILANRPDKEMFPNLSDNTIGGNTWFDNTGPHWEKKNSIVSYTDEADIRDVFDILHSQWDPVYQSKSNSNSDTSMKNLYDFIMGKDELGRPSGSSTSSWVSWGTGDGDDDVTSFLSNNGVRHFILPSETNPIPMYGIQEYDAIDGDSWKKGSIFNLSRKAGEKGSEKGDKSISLLRSVVKLELLIHENIFPTYTDPEKYHVSLWYANIYARCEPMNVWTPTDQLWKDDHDKDCEWLRVRDYGLLSKNGTSDAFSFKQRLSWFYGIWLDKDWQFTGAAGFKKDYVVEAEPAYPQIFNPYVQRNKTVLCDRSYVEKTSSGYYRWVVYTGERNMNDPSNLGNFSTQKNQYCAYWTIGVDGQKYYSIPLADYANATRNLTQYFGPEVLEDNGNSNIARAMDSYCTDNHNFSGANLPLPLMRNHIYRFYIGGSKPDNVSSRSADEVKISVRSEVLATEDICFKK